MSLGSKRRHEGYLMVDQRFAPPVPFNPALEGKCDQPITQSGTLLESATVTCCHCQRIVILNPNRSRERGFCVKCGKYTCDQCTAVGECRPFEALADAIIEAAVKSEASHNQGYFNLNTSQPGVE